MPNSKIKNIQLNQEIQFEVDLQRVQHETTLQIILGLLSKEVNETETDKFAPEFLFV